MHTLITPVQALRLAFAPDECLTPDALTEADLAAAEVRYLHPVLGEALCERLRNADDRSFVDCFLAPPLALFARLLAQPRLDIRTGRTGTAAPRPDGAAAAPAEARRALRQSLLTEARSLLRQAVARIESDPAAFPDYHAGRNVLHRCSIHGKLVQTL